MNTEQLLPSADEFSTQFFPPIGYEDYCVVESRGFLVWMKREDVGPNDLICFYDGDYRDVLRQDDPRLQK